MRYTPQKLITLSRKAHLLSLESPAFSPSSSSPSNSPAAKPAGAQVPGRPLPAPLSKPRTMSWRKRKGGFARSFSVSLGLGRRGCRISAVRMRSPLAPTS